ncbi:formamidopyrimidine-DNA glycosylase [Oikeobacillus pervagus]|uniref:Formamidopyrimidine-DNA glycosylase n=1 Tax=Oikeobacillus pervagus TaxID=1325931 RepID=A0AAJ1WGU2_9BACI|nr:DNA-formamidopyrimidine glycosylase [Oikeobacillus pervagus]MDQ0215477.1 formamidopyrimidine-DNA glycosylase [Oikeobacillus pervagus]
MPELPEVETVRQTLRQLVLGKEIKKVIVYWPKIIKKPEPVEQFTDALKGEIIREINRRGKFLLFEFDHYVMVSHLRMEGKYQLNAKMDEMEPHTHVIFQFTDDTELRYKDVRKFGTMHLFKKGTEFDSLPLSQLGPEPFSKELTVSYLKKVFHKTERKIKAVLLDQKVIVGLGNIYVDEVLFRSKIHPERKANSLSSIEIQTLQNEIIFTLREAVEKGGSTIRSYVNSQGEMGMFQFNLFVYGQEGEKCKNCGETIIKIKTAGRGTHICPSCQIPPIHNESC